MAESKFDGLGHSGDSFSPAGLLAAALGACALNIMGLYAARNNLDITGAEADVTPNLPSSDSALSSLDVIIRMPARSYSDQQKEELEKCVGACPVSKSIASGVKQNIRFIWL